MLSVAQSKHLYWRTTSCASNEAVEMIRLHYALLSMTERRTQPETYPRTTPRSASATAAASAAGTARTR